jgi:hypothetical protein
MVVRKSQIQKADFSRVRERYRFRRSCEQLITNIAASAKEHDTGRTSASS